MLLYLLKILLKSIVEFAEALTLFKLFEARRFKLLPVVVGLLVVTLMGFVGEVVCCFDSYRLVSDLTLFKFWFKSVIWRSSVKKVVGFPVVIFEALFVAVFVFCLGKCEESDFEDEEEEEEDEDELDEDEDDCWLLAPFTPNDASLYHFKKTKRLRHNIV